MNNLILKSATLLASLCLTACMEDVSRPIEQPETDTPLDLNFDFSTRQSCSLKLSAINEQGKPAVKALFSIYEQDPTLGEDGGRKADVYPLYQGLTDANGQISVDLELSAKTTQLYIYPEMAGLGLMQTVTPAEAASGLTFKGNQLPAATKASATRAEGDIERDRKDLGNIHKFFSYFTDEELNEKGSLNINQGLVTSDPLPDAYKEKVTRMFPEKTAYTGDESNTDLIITSENGAEVWATYIGDGGYVEPNKNRYFRNGLYYYIYTENNAPAAKYNVESDEYVLTAIFPNVNPFDGITTGTRVQLLYYDKAKGKYVTVFPKGTHIGFVLNHKGYNPNGNISQNGYGFGLTVTTIDGNPYCSTKEFNKDKNTHGILVWDDEFQCYTLGMERQGATGDNDFNDILTKIVCSPVKQGQTGTVPTPETQPIVSSYQGILAFEDNWPYKGDYDFNDFVTAYTYKLIKDATSGLVTGMELTFTPKAIGASGTNGFGIQLPVSTTNVSIENASLEAGNSRATVIVYSNVREAFAGKTGFINTELGNAVTAASKTFRLTFTTPMAESEVALKDFNPFLFRDSRDREIHLVDYSPTEKADMAWFRKEGSNDKSDTTNGVYYRMDNRNPWALDISVATWMWPLERKDINLAYPDYSRWYENWEEGKVADWTDNANATYLWSE